MHKHEIKEAWVDIAPTTALGLSHLDVGPSSFALRWGGFCQPILPSALPSTPCTARSCAVREA